MAILFGRGATLSGTTSPLAAAVTINAGETAVVFVGLNPSTLSVSGVTDNGGNVYTKRGEKSDGTIKIECWATEAGATVAATSVSAAITGTITDAVNMASAYTGVLSLGSSLGTNNGTTSNPSTSYTTEDANDFALTGFAANDGNGWTNIGGASGTMRLSDANISMAGSTVDNTGASPGSLTTADTHSVTGGHWVSATLELRSVPASVPAPLMSRWSRVGRVMMPPRVQTVSAAVAASFRRTLHPFGAGKGNRRKGK